MRTTLRLGALLLALVSISAPAFADGRWGDHGRNGRDGRDGDSHQNRGHYDNRRDAYRHGYRDGYRDDRRHDRRIVYRPAYHNNYYVAPRPIYRGPPRWARGGRYYGRGYGPTYVVNDYYGYGLRRPPPGYYWRRSDAGDFLLVALTTGIIADLVLHH